MSAFESAIPMQVEDQVVRLAQLPVQWIHRRRFVRCAIIGPPPALLSGCFIQGSRWLGLNSSSFTVVSNPADRDELPPGTILFIECTFDDCEFIDFTAVGSQDQINALRVLFPQAL